MEKVKYKDFKDRYNNKKGYKEEYMKKYNRRILCECGSIVSGLNYSKHVKTKKHMAVVNAIEKYKNNSLIEKQYI
jgi:hypothetical protein